MCITIEQVSHNIHNTYVQKVVRTVYIEYCILQDKNNKDGAKYLYQNNNCTFFYSPLVLANS